MKLPKGCRLIPIKGVPDDVEVLYPMWHHGVTKDRRRDMPAPYINDTGKTPDGMGIKSDFLWAWVFDPRLRLNCLDRRRVKADGDIESRYGKDAPRYFRSPRWGRGGPDAWPVRIFGAVSVRPRKGWYPMTGARGKKWRWYWLITDTCPAARSAAKQKRARP